MLMQTTSAGAIGGSVSSAISRPLGANNVDRANALAWHAATIGIVGGLFFTLMMLLFGRRLFALLGGDGAVLAEATGYATVLFSGAIVIWMLASILRGTGNMRASARDWSFC